MDVTCILVAEKRSEEQTPAIIRKHLNLLQQKSGFEPIYFRESISAYNRKRLIENKISFIVPGNQMYLPFLGIDLREYIKKLRSPESKIMSPSSQVVLLYSLLQQK